MSEVKSSKIDGDVSVGRNIAVGGNTIIQGNSHNKGNLRVDGWLDAKNIKGAGKGMFESVEKLRAAYPRPHDGWWAIVGKTLPSPIYVGEGGDWVATGEVGGNPTIDSQIYEDGLNRLGDDVSSLKTNLDSLSAAVSEQEDKVAQAKAAVEAAQKSSEHVRDLLASIQVQIQRIVGPNGGVGIDSFNEVLNFLHGLKDDVRLKDLLGELVSRLDNVENKVLLGFAETLRGMDKHLKTIEDVLNGNASEAIDNFNEVLSFLSGIKDNESLVSLLDEVKGRIDKVIGENKAHFDKIEASVKDLEDNSAMTSNTDYFNANLLLGVEHANSFQTILDSLDRDANWHAGLILSHLDSKDNKWHLHQLYDESQWDKEAGWIDLDVRGERLKDLEARLEKDWAAPVFVNVNKLKGTDMIMTFDEMRSLFTDANWEKGTVFTWRDGENHWAVKQLLDGDWEEEDSWIDLGSGGALQAKVDALDKKVTLQETYQDKLDMDLDDAKDRLLNVEEIAKNSCLFDVHELLGVERNETISREDLLAFLWGEKHDKEGRSGVSYRKLGNMFRFYERSVGMVIVELLHNDQRIEDFGYVYKGSQWDEFGGMMRDAINENVNHLLTDAKASLAPLDIEQKVPLDNLPIGEMEVVGFEMNIEAKEGSLVKEQTGHQYAYNRDDKKFYKSVFRVGSSGRGWFWEEIPFSDKRLYFDKKDVSLYRWSGGELFPLTQQRLVNVIDTLEDGFYIVDKNLNVGARFTKNKEELFGLDPLLASYVKACKEGEKVNGMVLTWQDGGAVWEPNVMSVGVGLDFDEVREV